MSVLPPYLAQLSRLSQGTGILDQAYVSFVSGLRYTELVTWSLRAAMRFSSRPIVLFTSGDTSLRAATLWPPNEFDRLIVINMPPPGPLHPWFDKLRAALLSPVRYGVIIEADSYITMHADNLFPLLASTNRTFPLSPTHMDIRLPNCTRYSGRKYCSQAWDIPEASRSIDYIHAHLAWTYASKPFIARAVQTCLLGKVAAACQSDEKALNLAYWKEGATEALCVIDPFVSQTHEWAVQSNGTLMQGYDATVAFMIMHGNKNASLAPGILTEIASMFGRPWVFNSRHAAEYGAVPGWHSSIDAVTFPSTGKGKCII